MNEQRLTFECWNCEKTFSLLLDSEFISACPYCEKEVVIDLNPFRTGKTSVLRGDSEDAIGAATGFIDIIPTRQPEAKPE